MTKKKHPDQKPASEPPAEREPTGDRQDSAGTEARLTVTLPAAEYEEQKAQAADYKDRWLRAVADYDNLRKRVEKEREEIMCYANERLISDLLPILDNLDRALEAAPDRGSAQAIAEGVRMVARQLTGVLSACGLENMPAVGQPFDPNMHQAVAVLPSPGHAEGTVVTELQKGYRLKGRVLRPSMVHVAGPSEEDGGGQEGRG